MKHTKSIYFASGLSLGIGCSLIISTFYQRFYQREIEHEAIIHGSPGTLIV